MKTSFVLRGLAFILAIIITLNLRAQTGGFAVTERGPDWKVLQKTTVEHGTNRIHRYTELATGMNYTNASGQLTESREQISIFPGGGAAALQGRHKVYFPADIYNGVIEVVTPDGRHLKSRPLGVSYDDGSNTVFIATLKHVQGYLTSSNTVTYRDAFTGFKADLVCTYRRGGFECDLVFRQQPPTPGDYGLDETFSTLQLVTEFFNTADPQEIPAGSDDWFGLQDSTLKFGGLTMTHGKAFGMKAESGSRKAEMNAAPVYKSWIHSAGRTFLIETVPVLDLADDLNALPLTARNVKPENGNLPVAPKPGVGGKPEKKTLLAASGSRFPVSAPVTACTNQIQLALAAFDREPGVVLDYNTIDSDQTDYTFENGWTYLIAAPIWLGDGSGDGSSVVFEGGAVIKYADSAGTGISFGWTDVSWPSDPDFPVILTSKDDDSVGEIIDGSTGQPTTLTDVTFISGPVENPVGNLRFYYAGQAMVWSDPAYVYNCQFVNCLQALCVNGYYGGEVDLYNCLFSHCYIDLNYSGMSPDAWVSFSADHVTADYGTYFYYEADGGYVAGYPQYSSYSLSFYNCLFTRYQAGGMLVT